ncbi:hypothetical protein HN51_044390 [Arachis hypogaea]
MLSQTLLNWLQGRMVVNWASLCNCFQSKELVEVTKMCREMKRMVPEILEVEVDPKGGPEIVEEDTGDSVVNDI